MAEMYLNSASIATPLSAILKIVGIEGSITAGLAGGVRCWTLVFGFPGAHFESIYEDCVTGGGHYLVVAIEDQEVEHSSIQRHLRAPVLSSSTYQRYWRTIARLCSLQPSMSRVQR